MSVKICCDFCDRPLPKVMVDGPEGEYDKLPITKFYSTKEVDTKLLFPHLCESCATKLDRAFALANYDWLRKIDILDRNSKINAARRELLGTKG